ncbi:flagellar basal body-associated FliL family protein [Mobilitalea sibirica]|uniref:Flagellar protein FliL n=1 Tax=Mobilitalea sibirica TaxID=1462919 RepID=A0A8J7HCE7_9FIRM|nr:flagellar basal body-associated FliL family protein [Mobilitalea sibirica]MBH1941996.1 flagellar basal body-associated FliL family protein [Mobilitalea sibirica]
MKKNILTIIILAMALINVVLSAVIIFVIVPTSNKTNNLVSKVAQIIDLELESPDADQAQISVSDIETYDIEEKLTINLKKSDSKNHYAILYVALSINKKHKDTVTLQPLIQENETIIKEMIRDEFTKYTIDEVDANKNAIKDRILARIQEYFESDFIINVSFGNLILE